MVDPKDVVGSPRGGLDVPALDECVDVWEYFHEPLELRLTANRYQQSFCLLGLQLQNAAAVRPSLDLRAQQRPAELRGQRTGALATAASSTSAKRSASAGQP